MFRKPTNLLTAALAAALFGFTASVLAEDVADIQIISDQTTHAITLSLDDLAVGESRQLTASSGQPTVVTRTESGLIVEVAGKRTEVLLAPPGGDATWVSGGAADNGSRVIKIERNAEITSSGDGEHKVIMIKKGEAGAVGDGTVEIITENLVGPDGAVDDEHIMELISEIDTNVDGDATKVIVTRRITSDGDSQD